MKIRKNITITPTEDYLLKQMAEEFQVSQSVVIGEALRLLSKAKRVKNDKGLLFVYTTTKDLKD